MKGLKRQEHTIDSLFPIALFFTFAMLSLVIMLFAANSYKHIVDDSINSNETNTAISYVIEKIHANDIEDAISVGKFDGASSLIIKDINSDDCCTYIYAHDGMLKELYTQSGANATLSSGKDIIKIKNFNIKKSKHSTVELTCIGTDGHTETANVSIRCE